MSANASSLSLERVTIPRVALALPLAAGASAAGNLALFGVASALGFAPAVAPDPSNPALQAVTVGMVIGASIVPAIPAALLLAALGRFVKKPVRVFRVIAAAFLLLSFFPVLTAPMDSTGSRLILGLMHVVAGLAIGGVLSIRGRELSAS